jgi:hypothetical protein
MSIAIRTKKHVVHNIINSINTSLDLLFTELEDMRDLVKEEQKSTEKIEIKTSLQDHIDRLEETIQSLEEFDLNDMLGNWTGHQAKETEDDNQSSGLSPAETETT